MTWPTVTELPPRLKPVTRDPFIDSSADSAAVDGTDDGVQSPGPVGLGGPHSTAHP
jgi:hypothetical protein